MRQPTPFRPAPPSRQEEPPRDPAVQLCVFLVGAEEYAVDIMRVRELLHPHPIIPLRGAPSFLEGVIQHYKTGAILPLVDLRKRLLGPQAPPPERTRLLVCYLGRRRVAFAVDRVTEVVRLRRSEIKPAPALGAQGPWPYVVGVYQPPQRPERSRPERLKLLLDVRALLRAELAREAARRVPA